MGFDVFDHEMTVSKLPSVTLCCCISQSPWLVSVNFLILVEGITRNLCRSKNILKFQTVELLMNFV